jgi:HTH-type transcriptional regulator/antitoxin HigA
MTIKLIKSEQDYDKAISLLEAIGDKPNFENDKNRIDEFELLEKLITDYESKNYKLDKGDPIEIIKMKMNYMDLIQKDLIGVIGSKGIVSEVLNKKRGLSKSMIRNLSKFLSINQDILNTEYQLYKDDSIISEKEILKFLIPIGIDTSFITNKIKSRGVTFAMCS